MKIRNYRNYDMWCQSMETAKIVFDTTKDFPVTERYGLVDQMRRSAFSIPSNIAEGSQREGEKDFNKFLGYARGSAAELETQLLISESVGYLLPEKAAELVDKVYAVNQQIFAFQCTLKKAIEQKAEEKRNQAQAEAQPQLTTLKPEGKKTWWLLGLRRAA